MRDLLLFGIIFSLLPVCFARPWMGVLVFSWISYMNPHRLTWGAAYDFPFAKIVAIVTIVGLLFTKDKSPLPKTRETILIILLGVYFTVTTFVAFNPDAAWRQWQNVIKILVMTLVTLILINDERKLRYLLLVVVFSIGFFGVKGGLFSLATGGNYRVWGPEGSFFVDNNDLALALNMTLPIIFCLATNEKSVRLKLALWFTFFCSILAVLFTYSRGGFLTLAVVGLLLLLKTRYKVWAVPVVIVALIIGMAYVPEKWFDRIESIKNYEEDASAMGRINAWKTAWNLASDRPFTGGGFDTFTRQVFARYAPNPSDVHDVHSIYFEMLGEHGFVALGLYLMLLLSTVLSAQRLKRKGRLSEEYTWAVNYGTAFQISLIAYMVGGVFLGRAYFDLIYHIVAMVTISSVLLARQMRTNTGQSEVTT